MKRKWKTKDNRTIKIKNMTINHIKNCIKLLEERFISVRSFNAYINSYEYNSNAINLCIEREFLNKLPNISIDYFKEELKKRELKNKIKKR